MSVNCFFNTPPTVSGVNSLFTNCPLFTTHKFSKHFSMQRDFTVCGRLLLSLNLHLSFCDFRSISTLASPSYTSFCDFWLRFRHVLIPTTIKLHRFTSRSQHVQMLHQLLFIYSYWFICVSYNHYIWFQSTFLWTYIRVLISQYMGQKIIF